MNVHVNSLDPQALALLFEQMRLVAEKQNPTQDEQRALAMETARRQAAMVAWQERMKRNVAWSLGGVLGGVGVIAGATVALLIAGFPHWAWLPGTLGGVSAGVAGILSARRDSRARKADIEKAQCVEHDALSAWLGLLELPRLERLYFEAVQILANEKTEMDDEIGSAILQQLNSLLVRSRELDVKRRSISSVLGAGDSARLQEERDQLTSRMQSASDPIARQALEDSIEMCDGRIANLGKLKPALERIEAQQEAVLQTMASVQSSLARWQAAPSIAESPDLQRIQQAVTRINDETYAVEEAVQEVMALSN